MSAECSNFGCPSIIKFNPDNRVTIASFCRCREGRIEADHFHNVMCEFRRCVQEGCYCECHMYGSVRPCRRKRLQPTKWDLGDSIIQTMSGASGEIKFIDYNYNYNITSAGIGDFLTYAMPIIRNDNSGQQ